MALNWKIFTRRPYIQSLSLEEQIRLFQIANEKSIRLRESKFQDFANSNSTSQGAAGDGDTAVVGFTNTRSLAFDGINDQVAYNNSIGNGFSAITVSAWAKFESIDNTYESILSKDGSSQRTWGLARWRSGLGGGVYFMINNGSTTYFSDPSPATDFVPVAGEWNHFIGLYNGAEVKLYVNGNTTPVSNTGATGTINTTTSQVKVGNSDYSEILHGGVDEVGIWNRALTDSEIEQVYNGGAASDLTSLSPLHWWRFEEGSGTTAIDLGSGAVNGTITSATYTTDVPT